MSGNDVVLQPYEVRSHTIRLPFQRFAGFRQLLSTQNFYVDKQENAHPSAAVVQARTGETHTFFQFLRKNSLARLIENAIP
jgi:hypothetical protein